MEGLVCAAPQLDCAVPALHVYRGPQVARHLDGYHVLHHLGLARPQIPTHGPRAEAGSAPPGHHYPGEQRGQDENRQEGYGQCHRGPAPDVAEDEGEYDDHALAALGDEGHRRDQQAEDDEKHPEHPEPRRGDAPR